MRSVFERRELRDRGAAMSRRHLRRMPRQRRLPCRYHARLLAQHPHLPRIVRRGRRPGVPRDRKNLRHDNGGLRRMQDIRGLPDADTSVRAHDEAMRSVRNGRQLLGNDTALRHRDQYVRLLPRERRLYDPVDAGMPQGNAYVRAGLRQQCTVHGPRRDDLRPGHEHLCRMRRQFELRQPDADL
jgi:hypothetical protein